MTALRALTAGFILILTAVTLLVGVCLLLGAAWLTVAIPVLIVQGAIRAAHALGRRRHGLSAPSPSLVRDVSNSRH
jgi:predicted signal transduction protein with EAL and GGDEF domain